MSPWIEHIKATQQKYNGCSYKEAMKLASASYNKKCKPCSGAGLKQTAKKVGSTVEKFEPVIDLGMSMAAPEAVVAYKAAKIVNKMVKDKKKTKGGSFKVMGAGAGAGCKTCGGSVLGKSSSSMISPQHPSFTPKKPKSFAELKHTN